MEQTSKLDLILDHYETPRNHSEMADADIVQFGGNPGCGDVIKLYLKIDEQGKITAVSFEGEGCTISQAATSMITEIILGKTVDEVEAMDPRMIFDIVGKNLAMTRPKCSMLGINTAIGAAREWKRQQMLKNLANKTDSDNQK